MPVLLYRCEAWTGNEGMEKKFNSCEIWCYRKMLGIKWTYKRADESIRQQIAHMTGNTQRGKLEIAKERKMRLFGHVTRRPEDFELAHTIMQGQVPGNRAQGRPRRKWTDNIVRLTGLRVAEAVRVSSSRYKSSKCVYRLSRSMAKKKKNICTRLYPSAK